MSNLFLFAVCFFGGLFMLYRLRVMYKERKLLYARGINVLATIISVAEESDIDEGSKTYYTPTLTFKDEKGQLLESQGPSISSKFYVGDQIPIIYDPEVTNNIRYTNRGHKFRDLVFVGIGGIVFILAGIAILIQWLNE